MLSGWIGVVVSLLLMIPVLQRLGWQSTLGTAGLTAVKFLMIPNQASLNWDTVFKRGLDTVGAWVVALLVGLPFWPHSSSSSSSSELKATDLYLRRSLEVQLHACLGGLIRMAPP
jgi:hypothetical protein